MTIGDLAITRIRHTNGDADDEELELVRKNTVFDVGVCENLASAMSNYVAPLLAAGSSWRGKTCTLPTRKRGWP